MKRLSEEAGDDSGRSRTLVAMLDRLKLTAIWDQLDTLLDEAARSDMTLRESLA